MFSIKICLIFLNNLSTMRATFANPPPPTHTHLLDFEINLSTPIPNHTHARTHARTHAHTHTHTASMEEHVTNFFLFIANENDKGLLDTTRYNSYNYHITLANLCGEDPLQISLLLGKWDYRGMCNFLAAA